jgi:uncharacterized protein YbcI
MDQAQTEEELEVGRRLAAVQAHYYGHPPGGVFCQISSRFVVVLLRETFSQAERTLIERGESAGIQEIRRKFQQTMSQEFTAIVEQVTGQQVETFVSDTSLENDTSVEVFVLAGALEDMRAFERELERPRAPGHEAD